MKRPQFLEFFKAILINQCSTPSDAFISKMSESKYNLIQEMVK